MFAWLYDARLDGPYLAFVLLRVLTVHLTAAADIEHVREVGSLSIGTWNALNFKNRLFATTFLITLKHGWFTRRILVTPSDPSVFLGWCAAHAVPFTTRPL